MKHTIYWNEKYTGAEHAFDTTRKSGEIADAIGHEHITDPASSGHVALHNANDEIKKALSADYYEDLKTGGPKSQSNGFAWDYGIWEMAVNSTAGVMSATAEAIVNNTVAGSLSSGLHHAHHNNGAGFCTVNGLAVTANWLNSLHVTILDFDAHCGGGTVKMLRHLNIDSRVEQYDISTNYFDEYEEDETHTIRIARSDADYTDAVNETLNKVNLNTNVILYNAGTDPYPTISHETLAERENTVFKWATENNIPIAYVLAGGYTSAQTMDSLVESHLNTIYAADNAMELVVT
jgi:acetoin utilization deacetylase AcuC-like enzyme